MVRSVGPGRGRLRRLASRAWTIVAVGGLVAAGLVVGVSASSAVSLEASTAEVAPAIVETGVVKAADLSQFKAGNIISDAVFFNSATLTEAQIQSFLESKVSSCRSGYTCLKDYYVQTRSIAADAMCGAYSGGGMERASRVIYKVAQACGINPQVILVMLQKEQGLVTSTAPSAWAYQAAMGQGCPDTAACDTAYYGLFNQVYGGAWQMKRYANPPGTSNFFTWYAPGKTWNILYHPNTACGRGAVYVENQATANLYYYTPYQPNAAALAAGYSTGDGCSSYGNRNFFNYFTDWFGSTQVPSSGSFATLDATDHVLALTDDGTLLAYPFVPGESSWRQRVEVGTGATDVRALLSPGDFDGDGRRDLIIVDSAGSASLWRGDGLSTYESTGRVLEDWSQAVLITAAGDFSGDGVPDVFTTTAEGALMLWRGTGTGEFRRPVQVGNGWGVMDLLVGGDLSGDGTPDLVARDGTGRLWLYSGNGSGGFSGKLQIGNGWSGMSEIFLPGDFGGSSLPDILAVNAATGALQLYTGRGGGYLRSGGTVGTGWAGFVDIAGNLPSTDEVRSLDGGAGDVNGDGHRDLLALTPGGDLRAYYGNGRGGWVGSATIATGWGGQDRIVNLGDFTGDGEPDIGRVAENGIFTMLPSTGPGTRGDQVQIGNGWGIFDHLVGGVDFDGDGFTDVLAIGSDGRMVLYRGNGNGGWMSEARAVVGNGWQIADLVLAPGDWNGDGAPDLLMRRAADGSFWDYPLTGMGSFLAPKQFAARWDGMTVAAPGRFDETGGPDIIAYDATGRLYLYRGNGDGGWLGIRAQIGHGWAGMASIS